MLHRQYLVAKRLSPRLKESLGIAVKAINYVKANAKNDRLFRQLCKENDEEYERLLLHTEVRWLSKGESLARYCELQNSVVDFLGEDSDLAKDVIPCSQDTSYLADFFEKINIATNKLQGKNITLVQSKTVMSFFVVQNFNIALNKVDFFGAISFS